jgi:hypothetical protein
LTGARLARTTILNDVHRAAGARMVDFGGWDMPLHYGSQIEEHHAVRRAAGLFDVSHMQVVEFAGAGTRDFLRRALANNVDKLKAAAFSEIEKIAKDGTTDEYLDKVREQLKRGHETDLKENRWWVDELRNAYYYGDDFGKSTDLDAIEKRVTSDHVKATAKKFFTPNNVIFGVMKPKKP